MKFSRASLSWAANIFLLAAVYFVLGRLAFLLALPPGDSSPIWPPSGIALAWLLTFGMRAWPGVFLGAFLLNLAVPFSDSTTPASFLSLAVAMELAAGATLEAVAGAWLVRRRGIFPGDLSNPWQILEFYAWGGFFACLLNATLTPLGLWVMDQMTAQELPPVLWAWWVGDSIGVFIFAPLTLMLLGKPETIWRYRLRTAALPLVALTTIMVVWFVYISAVERRQIKDRFEDQCRMVANAAQRQLERHLDAVYDTAGLFKTGSAPSRTAFTRFAEGLLAHRPYFRALGWAPRVTENARAGFERAVQADGFPGFVIRDWRGGRLEPAARRPEYFPLLYRVPFDIKVQGLDLASEPVRQEALELARKTGQAASSAPLRLMQDPNGDEVYLLCAPVFATQEPGRPFPARPSNLPPTLSGFTVGIFDAREVAATAFLGLPTQAVQFIVRSQRPSGDWLMVYRHGPEDRPVTGATGLETSLEFSFAGRHLRFDFTPSEEFLKTSRSWRPWSAFAVGLLFTSLVGSGLLVITGRAAEIKAQVALRTTELSTAYEKVQESEARYRDLIENSSDLIQSVRPDGTFLFVNRAWQETLGYQPEDLKNLNVFDLIHQESRPHCEAAFRQILEGDHLTNLRFSLLAKDGRVIKIEGNASCSFVGGRPVATRGIFRDVSAREAAEEAVRQQQTVLERRVLERTDELNRAVGEYQRVAEDLRRARDELDVRVHERTQELSNAIESLHREVAERRAVEAELSEEREVLAAMVENIEAAVIACDAEGRLTLFNRAARNILGRPQPGFEPSDWARAHQVFQADGRTPVPPDQFPIFRALRGGRVSREELSIRDGEGQLHYCLASGQPIEAPDGRRLGAVVALQDVTESKLSEERTRASLVEKEALVREIHHRVKNNMQVISSLLQLQANTLADPVAKEAIKESQVRIRAMAMIHEKLYRTENLALVDLSDYVRTISAMLFRSYVARPAAVRLVLETSAPSVPIDTAIPVGLIANELLTNAFKYAFPGERGGQVTVRLAEAEAGQMAFSVEDDGVGFPPGRELEHARTLGLRLVQLFAKQIGGVVEINSAPGRTRVRVVFALAQDAGLVPRAIEGQL